VVRCSPLYTRLQFSCNDAAKVTLLLLLLLLRLPLPPLLLLLLLLPWPRAGCVFDAHQHHHSYLPLCEGAFAGMLNVRAEEVTPPTGQPRGRVRCRDHIHNSMRCLNYM